MDAGHAARCAVLGAGDHPAAGQHRRPVTVGPADAQLGPAGHGRVGQVVAQGSGPVGAAVGVHQAVPVAQRQAHVATPVAQHAEQAVIADHAVGIHVPFPGAHAGCVHHVRQQGLLAALLGDIGEAGHGAGGSTGFVADQLGIDRQPVQRAVGGRHPHDLAVQAMTGRHGPQRRPLGQRHGAAVLIQRAPMRIDGQQAQQLGTTELQLLFSRRVAGDHPAVQRAHHHAVRQGCQQGLGALALGGRRVIGGRHPRQADWARRAPTPPLARGAASTVSGGIAAQVRQGGSPAAG